VDWTVQRSCMGGGVCGEKERAKGLVSFSARLWGTGKWREEKEGAPPQLRTATLRSAYKSVRVMTMAGPSSAIRQSVTVIRNEKL
jgi:hypothetical protein